MEAEDEWRNKLVDRITELEHFETDLVTLNAQYHLTCIRWILGMLYLQCEQLEMFTEVSSMTSEQHVDMRPSRVSRHNLDIEKFSAWFSEHHYC